MRREQKALLDLSQPSFFLIPNGNRNLGIHREPKLFDSLEGDLILVTIEQLWGQHAIINLKNESHSLASDISRVLKGPPAEEPGALTEHGASTSPSDRKPHTAGRTA